MMLTRFRLIIVLFILPLCGLRAQRPFVQDIWLNENRTALKVTVMLQDAQGYILAGTAQGLYRYNGSTFRLIASVVHAPVTMLTAQRGHVWVGYEDGRVGYVGDDSVTVLHFPGYKPSAAVHALSAHADGSVWLGTEAGIIKVGKGAAYTYNTANGLSDDFIYTLLNDGRGGLLAGTDQGLNHIPVAGGRPGAATVFAAGHGLPDNIIRVLQPAVQPGCYWVGGQQGGLSLYDSRSGVCRKLAISGGWQWGQVNDILAVSADRLWVATEDGFLLEIIVPDKNAAVVVNAYANPDKRIYDLLLDRAGNIWCATSKGVSMVSAEYLRYIVLPQPYTLSGVTAICCDRGNVLWFALGEDVYAFSLNDEIKLPRRIFRAPAPVSVLYAVPGGQVWMGTSGAGVWIHTAATGTFSKVNVPGQEHENILSITMAGGHLWIAGLNGVKEFSRDEGGPALLRTHNKSSGAGSDYIYRLFGDRRGQVWMATDGAGVCMYDGGRYYHWSTFSAPDNTVAYTLTEDAGGAIWAGTLYKDLFRYQKGQWENIRRKEVQDIDVNLSTVDANATGQVIAVYQRCIDLWYPAGGFFRHFNSRHGMGIDSTSRVLNCSARDTAGNVWLPFEKGLLMFRNQQHIYDIKPGVHIRRISNNLHNVTGSRRDFGPDENYLSFYFDGLSFTNPERLNYRFRLEGYSDNWIYTNETVATFPRLPSGSFVFKVQVSLNGSFDNPGEASYKFTIAAPLWRRPWFISLAALAVISLTFLLIRFRDRRLKRLAQMEQERVVFDYEHLKSQVNPHFLFNSLNTLTNLIEEDRDGAITYTERLSDLYRNMLAYHNRDLILLREEWEILSAYLYIQQSRFGEALQISSDLPQALKDTRLIPPMALQLLVENAIKHNVVSRSSPLVVHISAENDEIVVRNLIRPKVKTGQESGIGLANIRSRYALLTRRKVYVGRDGDDWVVRLPLL